MMDIQLPRAELTLSLERDLRTSARSSIGAGVMDSSEPAI